MARPQVLERALSTLSPAPALTQGALGLNARYNLTQQTLQQSRSSCLLHLTCCKALPNGVHVQRDQTICIASSCQRSLVHPQHKRQLRLVYV